MLAASLLSPPFLPPHSILLLPFPDWRSCSLCTHQKRTKKFCFFFYRWRLIVPSCISCFDASAGVSCCGLRYRPHLSHISRSSTHTHAPLFENTRTRARASFPRSHVQFSDMRERLTSFFYLRKLTALSSSASATSILTFEDSLFFCRSWKSRSSMLCSAFFFSAIASFFAALSLSEMR